QLPLRLERTGESSPERRERSKPQASERTSEGEELGAEDAVGFALQGDEMGSGQVSDRLVGELVGTRGIDGGDHAREGESTAVEPCDRAGALVDRARLLE